VLEWFEKYAEGPSMNWLNRALCWLTGYHIEPQKPEELFRCRFCGQDTMYTRCTGWPKKKRTEEEAGKNG